MIAVVCLGFFILGALTMDFIISNDSAYKRLKSDHKKLLLYYYRFNMWMSIKNEGYHIADYLKEKGYNRVAIYGMKELGERLYEELERSEIDIVCVIDKNKNILGDFSIISPDENIPDIDLIIVTAEYYYREIKDYLKVKIDCPIVSLSGVLGGLSGRNID